MSKAPTKKTYGFELVMDLYGCNLDVLSSKKKLQEYVDTLCGLIEMKKYGKTLIPYFGENEEYTKGYSLVQLIETSSITGHFSEAWKTAYINVFSCKPYDHVLAKKFTKDFFQAARMKARLLTR
ncbi:MAG: S-adenosylmethionine decarboxylase [Candidatus Omnitrophica bacterium]|nr:S-adenosylmethionine decarboxylase [Candidatus Omnitrophota bacterium]